MPLELPPFSQYRPRKLKRLEKKFINCERSMDASFDYDRIDKALQKLKSGLD